MLVRGQIAQLRQRLQLLHQLRRPEIQLIRVGVFERVLILRAADAVFDGQVLDRLHVKRDAINARQFGLQALHHFTSVDFAISQRLEIDENTPVVESRIDAVNAVNRAKQELNMPPSLQATFQGTAAAFLRSVANEPILILAAIVTVYIVLGVLYESYIHPITILSTLPSAGVGAILALLLCRTEFSVIALIGIILLIGIVKKNAIMMIDFALEAERKEGKAPLDAIYEACLLRFRPIMMTTMAALLGGLPLALGSGVGSELRRPLGITIVGGLLLSQLLTLYTTPVVYLAFDWLARRFAFHIGNPIEQPAHGD